MDRCGSARNQRRILEKVEDIPSQLPTLNKRNQGLATAGVKTVNVQGLEFFEGLFKAIGSTLRLPAQLHPAQ